MLERRQRRARGEHPAGEQPHRILAPLDVVDLEERRRLGRLLGGCLAAVADDDRQRAETNAVADRRIDRRDARGDLVQALEHGDVLGLGRAGEQQPAGNDATPRTAPHRPVTTPP